MHKKLGGQASHRVIHRFSDIRKHFDRFQIVLVGDSLRHRFAIAGFVPHLRPANRAPRSTHFVTRIRGDVWPGPELRFIVAVGLSDVRWVTLSQKLQESEFFTKLLLFGAEVD